MNEKISLDDHPGYAELDEREREVLQLLAEGKSAQQIALIITCAVRTVDLHRHKIMKKLGIEEIADLAKFRK